MIETALAVICAAFAYLAWQGGAMLAEWATLDDLWPLIQPACVVLTLCGIDWMMRRV